MKRQSFLKGSAVLMAMVLVTKLIGMIYKVPLTNMLGGTGMSCYSGASRYSRRYSRRLRRACRAL